MYLMFSPHGGSTLVDVEINPAAFETHEAVFLNLGVPHVWRYFQVSRPGLVHPVDLSNDAWCNNLKQNENQLK
jgi:hypothetical protein